MIPGHKYSADDNTLRYSRSLYGIDYRCTSILDSGIKLLTSSSLFHLIRICRGDTARTVSSVHQHIVICGWSIDTIEARSVIHIPKQATQYLSLFLSRVSCVSPLLGKMHIRKIPRC